MSLLKAPNEILIFIAGFLPLEDLIQFTRVNRRLNAVLDKCRTEYIYDMKRGLLLWAAEKGHVSLAKQVLEMGVDIQERDYFSRYMTPLQLAARAGHTEMVCLLLEEGADITALCLDRHTALYYALWSGSSGDGAAKLLVAKHAESYRGSALHFALDTQDRLSFKILLERSLVPIDIQSKDGYTCLSQATRKGDLGRVILLLEYGASTSICDREDGKTPLHHAALHGALEYAKLLIDHGAGVNALDSENTSVLDCAEAGRQAAGETSSQFGEIIDLLIKKGAHSTVSNPPAATSCA